MNIDDISYEIDDISDDIDYISDDIDDISDLMIYPMTLMKQIISVSN